VVAPAVSAVTGRHRRDARVLLVSHEASRTGAPRVAVHVGRALRAARGVRVITILRWPGPLEPELRANSDRLVREPLRRVRVLLRRGRRTRRWAIRLESAVAWLVIAVVRPDVVYANTTLSACYVRPALAWRKRVVLHVHELEPLASDTLARYRLDDAWPSVELVACSTAVADNLVRITGRSDARVVHSVPDAAAIIGQSQAEWPDRPPGLVVGACGTPDHRKGADLFAAIATAVRAAEVESVGSVEFVWLGGEAPPDQPVGEVRFLAARSNPYPLLRSFDVLAVTSREDPFPLVVLEAMVLGTPVVAFDVGGLREQLGEAGVLVPAGDVEGFAAAVTTLLTDDEARRSVGAALAARAAERFPIVEFDRAIVDVVTGSSAPC
jgi:glycosyltransferase involved in cell wall biosynthesis